MHLRPFDKWWISNNILKTLIWTTLAVWLECLKSFIYIIINILLTFKRNAAEIPRVVSIKIHIFKIKNHKYLEIPYI